MAKDRQPQPGRKPLTAVIEDLGFGRAQIRQLCLAGVVLFGNGSQTAIASIMTLSIADEWHLNMLQRSLLITFLFSGMCLGGIFSGRIGDRWGRWYAVVISNIVQTLMGFLSAFSPNWVVLGVLRVLTGFGMGFGLPPMCALLSEVTPERWKIPIRAMNDAFFDLGFIYSAVLCSFDEPTLQVLHWRTLLMLNVLPPGLIGCLTFFFLQESPVFYASIGEDGKAAKILESFWRANKGPDSEPQVDYEPIAVAQDEGHGKSNWAELSVVLGPKYWLLTAGFCYTSFCCNIYFYGGMYAQPQVMAKSSETLVAGWQMVIGGVFDLFGLVLAAFVARLLGRKPTLIFSLVSCCVLVVCFGFAGAKEGRGFMMEALYQIGVFGFYWVPSMMFVVLYQFALDAYPTAVASTGSGLCQASGRLGAIFGPEVFEYIKKVTGKWEIFCYTVAVASFLATVFVAFIHIPASPSEDAFEDESNEKEPLLKGTKPIAEA